MALESTVPQEASLYGESLHSPDQHLSQSALEPPGMLIKMKLPRPNFSPAIHAGGTSDDCYPHLITTLDSTHLTFLESYASSLLLP